MSGPEGVTNERPTMFETITQAFGCQAPVGTAVSRQTGEVFRVACGRWRCDACGPRRVRRLRHRLREVPFTKFVTLTSPKSTVKEQSRAINRIRGALKRGWRDVDGQRRSPAAARYFWAREIGKNGVLHVHMLLEMRYLHQRALSRLAMRCGFGRVVDIRSIKTSRVGDYVIKYATKGRRCVLPRYTRRFQTSVQSVSLRKPSGAWLVEISSRCATIRGRSEYMHSLHGEDVGARCRACLEQRYLNEANRRWEADFEPLGRGAQRLLNLTSERKTQQVSVRWRDPGG